MNENLELISTEELVAELFNRFDIGAITLFKESTDEDIEIIEQANGELHHVVGLLEQMKFNIMSHLHQNTEMNFEEEEDDAYPQGDC